MDRMKITNEMKSTMKKMKLRNIYNVCDILKWKQSLWKEGECLSEGLKLFVSFSLTFDDDCANGKSKKYVPSNFLYFLWFN